MNWTELNNRSHLALDAGPISCQWNVCRQHASYACSRRVCFNCSCMLSVVFDGNLDACREHSMRKWQLALNALKCDEYRPRRRPTFPADYSFNCQTCLYLSERGQRPGDWFQQVSSNQDNRQVNKISTSPLTVTETISHRFRATYFHGVNGFLDYYAHNIVMANIYS